MCRISHGHAIQDRVDRVQNAAQIDVEDAPIRLFAAAAGNPGIGNGDIDGASSSAASIQARMADVSVTSKTAVSTSAPASRQAIATAFRRPSSRPLRTSRTSGAAYSRARAAPMPLDAPVIKIVLMAAECGAASQAARLPNSGPSCEIGRNELGDLT